MTAEEFARKLAIVRIVTCKSVPEKDDEAGLCGKERHAVNSMIVMAISDVNKLMERSR